MLDPLFPAPPVLVKATQPIADFLSLSTLPLHIHEVLFGWTCYHLICNFVSPVVSAFLFPEAYRRFPARTKLNWDVHFTSLIQSTYITAFALFVIWRDEERKQMDWTGRIWGYTGAGGAVQGCAAGYFLWDLAISLSHIDMLGRDSVAHALSALLVTSLGFRPFANYYGLNFVLYEVSTPFLNFHWFLDKLNMTGSRIQLYNGITLLVTFFGCRVLWGNYQSFRIYSDVWTAIRTPSFDQQTDNGVSFFPHRQALGSGLDGVDDFGIMTLPPWLVILYLGSNTILNLLNMYWFALMIKALRKRCQPSEKAPQRKKMNAWMDVDEHVD